MFIKVSNKLVMHCVMQDNDVPLFLFLKNGKDPVNRAVLDDLLLGESSEETTVQVQQDLHASGH